MQFASQTESYRGQYPHARFDIVERAGEAIGRMVVVPAANRLHRRFRPAAGPPCPRLGSAILAGDGAVRR